MCARPWARHFAAVWNPWSTPASPPTSASAGNAHVVEVDVRGPGAELAHLVVLGSDRESRRARGHEERRDAPVAGGLGVGAGEHHDHVGDGGVGDVALRTVEHPVGAVAPRRRREPGRVGARVGLGEPERRGHLAGGQTRQPRLLLLVGAPDEQHLPGDAVVGAEERTQRGCGPAQLERELRLLGERHAEPAVLLGDGEPVEPHLLAGGDDPLRDGVLGVDLLLDRHDLLAHEVAHRGQHVGQVGGLHVDLPSALPVPRHVTGSA